MENAQIFEAASTVALCLAQSVVSPPKRQCGEEVFPVFEKPKSAGFAHQRPDDVPVVDTVASSAQEPLHSQLMFSPVIDLHAIIINPDPDHLADEPGRDRVDVVLDVYGAPGGDPDVLFGKLRDSIGCNRFHHGQLFVESPSPEPVRLLYDLD